MKTVLKYIGVHQANDYIEVDDNLVEELLESKQFIKESKKNHNKTIDEYKKWLDKVPHIGEKTIEILVKEYPTFQDLLKENPQNFMKKIKQDIAIELVMALNKER